MVWNGVFSYIYEKWRNVHLNEPCDFFCHFYYALTVHCYYRLSTAITDLRHQSEIQSHQIVVILLYQFLVNINLIPKYTIFFFSTVLWTSRCCNYLFEKISQVFLVSGNAVLSLLFTPVGEERDVSECAVVLKRLIKDGF